IETGLLSLLRCSAGLLSEELLFEDQYSLKSEVIEACDRVHHPTYRIAVFGPFNYGKSTLLNAILGEKTLPMDLVPTTGAAITIKYGAEPRTCITHTNGSVQEESGTKALKEYAVLDEQRQMRADVSGVDVYCPHPLLKLGIELIDLPGTDDTQAQNDLVKKQLLSADLVIQLLDGRKLMTLAERENLRDWLLDRGINTVIFVVNFLNLMEPGERQKMALRLRFLAESFRAQLPDGVSNLYLVDALPALRARLKGDTAAATETGLPALESALQTVGTQLASGRPPAQTLPRLKVVAEGAIAALKEQIDALSSMEPSPTDLQKVAIKQQAQGLIQSGFVQSIGKLRGWLSPQNLQAHYRLGLAQALEDGSTQTWLLKNLEPAWLSRIQPITDWVHQASEIFERECLPDLQMSFVVEGSESAATAEEKAEEKAVEQSQKASGVTPVAIATGLGWILGGPLGAAVLGGTSHLINKSGTSSKSTDQKADPKDIDWVQQANIYLERFSHEASLALTNYEAEGTRLIQSEILVPSPSASPMRTAQLNLLQSTLDELTELVSAVPASF
ncbi:MAG: dynamin family protein, partial [Cyanobacteria bacterium J06560_2]